MHPRVSGRLGNIIDLNVTFFRNGIATDPYAIRKVSIYRSAVKAENLIAEIPVVILSEPDYPNPLTREVDTNNDIKPGIFHLYWDVPESGIPVPDTFFDVWSYIPTNPSTGTGTGTSGTGVDLDDTTLWHECCNQFWLAEDGFYCDDGLQNVRLGFEPLDVRFNQPEVRTLEVGMMPLPLYDFDYNLIAPLIPQLQATFTLMTDNCEVLIDAEPMRIGLRQGTFRTNPFVLQYTFDTARVLKGTYKYKVAVRLPNGETRVSESSYLTVA